MAVWEWRKAAYTTFPGENVTDGRTDTGLSRCLVATKKAETTYDFRSYCNDSFPKEAHKANDASSC